jgi:hypothetical protein
MVSTVKGDRHDITEMLLKMALATTFLTITLAKLSHNAIGKRKREGQTIQWSKDRRTENTMDKRKRGQTIQWAKEKEKDRQYNGHDITEMLLKMALATTFLTITLAKLSQRCIVITYHSV